MTVWAVLRSSLMATLAQPVAWPVALAGFLVRGGIVLFVLPIVVLPSPVGVADRITPIVSAAVLGGLSAEVVVLIMATCALVVSVVLLAGWFAAASEAALIRHAPDWDELDPHRAIAAPRPGESARILAARIFADLPLFAVLAWGAIRISDAAYLELTQPIDVSTPIVIRVMGAIPEVVILGLATWAIGQVLGGIAARRVVVLGMDAPGALRTAVVEAVRRPLRMAILFMVPTIALVAVLIPTLAATASTWDRVRIAIRSSVGAAEGIATISIFVGLWLGGLVLVAMVCAWRAGAWTLDAEQRTFGVSPPVHPGDWSDAETSDTL